MIKIHIQNPCSCAKKRKAWMKDLFFETMEEANKTAQKMLIQGNEKFCKKHKFVLEENDNSIEIIALSNKKRKLV